MSICWVSLKFGITFTFLNTISQEVHSSTVCGLMSHLIKSWSCFLLDAADAFCSLLWMTERRINFYHLDLDDHVFVGICYFSPQTCLSGKRPNCLCCTWLFLAQKLHFVTSANLRFPFSDFFPVLLFLLSWGSKMTHSIDVNRPGIYTIANECCCSITFLKVTKFCFTFTATTDRLGCFFFPPFIPFPVSIVLFFSFPLCHFIGWSVSCDFHDSPVKTGRSPLSKYINTNLTKPHLSKSIQL